MQPNIRIGQGYDVHQLREGIEFWLGCHKIEHEKGAFGHSDADVLSHVICDALLGAAGMRDIGVHYPDTDARYKGASGRFLLQETVKIIADGGWKIGNIDATVCIQKPKISPYIPEMTKKTAHAMGVLEAQINLKATTTEKLGFVGRQEGVAAFAVALIYKH